MKYLYCFFISEEYSIGDYDFPSYGKFLTLHFGLLGLLEHNIFGYLTENKDLVSIYNPSNKYVYIGMCPSEMRFNETKTQFFERIVSCLKVFGLCDDIYSINFYTGRYR